MGVLKNLNNYLYTITNFFLKSSERISIHSIIGIPYKIINICNEAQNFFTWKTPKLTVEIKIMRSKIANRNPLYEIKCHKFSWPLYIEELLFSTYNLTHVRNIRTSDCSSEYALALLKGWISSTQDSKLESFE